MWGEGNRFEKTWCNKINVQGYLASERRKYIKILHLNVFDEDRTKSQLSMSTNIKDWVLNPNRKIPSYRNVTVQDYSIILNP